MNVMYPGIERIKGFRNALINHLASYLPDSQVPNPPSFGMDAPWQPSTYQDAGRGVMNALIPEPEDTLMGLMKPSLNKLKNSLFKKIIKSRDEDFYDAYGIRSLPHDQKLPKKGDILDNSYNWIDNEIYPEEILNGTSSLGVMDWSTKPFELRKNIEIALNKISDYHGNRIVLIGGSSKSHGVDPLEYVIPEAEVLKIFKLPTK